MCRKSSLHSLRKRPRTGAFCNISPESSRIALMNWISQMDASTASRFRLSDSSDTRRPHGARRSQSRETPMSARPWSAGTPPWADGELFFTPAWREHGQKSLVEVEKAYFPSEMDAHSERAKWAHLPARGHARDESFVVRKEERINPRVCVLQSDSRSARSSRPGLAANQTTSSSNDAFLINSSQVRVQAGKVTRSRARARLRRRRRRRAGDGGVGLRGTSRPRGGCDQGWHRVGDRLPRAAGGGCD